MDPFWVHEVHLSYNCPIIDEAMKRCIKAHHVHIGSLPAYFFLHHLTLNPALSIALKKIQLPCRWRHCFSRQLACSISGNLYLMGVQTSFNQSRREILNLSWLAFTMGQTIIDVICLP